MIPCKRCSKISGVVVLTKDGPLCLQCSFSEFKAPQPQVTHVPYVMTVNDAIKKHIDWCLASGPHHIFHDSGTCKGCGKNKPLRFDSCLACSGRLVTDYMMVWDPAYPAKYWQTNAAKN